MRALRIYYPPAERSNQHSRVGYPVFYSYVWKMTSWAGLKKTTSYFGQRSLSGQRERDIKVNIVLDPLFAVSQPAISKASKRGGEYCEAHNLEWKTVAKGRRDR